MSFVIELLALAPIIYMWNAFDRVLTSRSMVTLVSLTVIVLGVYVLWSVLDWLRTRMLIRLSMRLDWDLATDVFDASFRQMASRRRVNVQQMMTDTLELRQFLSGKGLIAIMDAPFAVLFIGVGAMFHPWLGMFLLAAALLMLLAALLNRKVSTGALKAASNANNEAQRFAAAVQRQSETTLALGMMPAMRQRWHRRHRAFLGLHVNASEAAGAGAGVSEFMRHTISSLGLGLSLLLAIEGMITAGMVIAASMLVNKATGPLQKLITHWPEVVRARQAYERLNLLLTQDSHKVQRMALPTPRGDLVVKDLVAQPMPGRPPVLEGVNFTLAPGQIMAIIGPSASGKSSLVRLLVGIWKPTEGSVRLDGVEVSDWDHDAFGRHLGYVPQEIEFFEGGVAENIARFGEVDPDKVIEAARLVGLHEVILGWPMGYETPLGDAGFPLSSGQRQRLAIARALYDNPRLVVMDEPNANLDEVGEASLIQALQQLRERGVTVVVTTHRPRLVSVVDVMLVLRAGRQIGFGPPKDLLGSVVKRPEASKPADDAAVPDAISPESPSNSSIAMTRVTA
jgi:PrtD family type I secretion system ABC transporter